MVGSGKGWGVGVGLMNTGYFNMVHRTSSTLCGYLGTQKILQINGENQ